MKRGFLILGVILSGVLFLWTWKDVEKRRKAGELTQAIFQGDQATVDRLLAEGVSLDQPDLWGHTGRETAENEDVKGMISNAIEETE